MEFGNAFVSCCIMFIVCFGYVQNRRNINPKNYILDRNSDIYLNSIQLISKHGYTPEIHTVITEDGYLLSCYRIPNSGPPVLLVHGIGDSSDSWLVLGPSKSLAFQLSDLGYDVWIYNARGNKYSKGHIKNLNDKAYWNFSYEEMGTQDLRAVIDFILRSTSRLKLTYVGFSQGTTIFFVMCSTSPEYNDKIEQAILLAPVAWISNIKYPFIDVLSQNLEVLYSFLNSINIYELFSDNALLNLYHAKVCSDSVPEHILCKLEFYISYGLRNISNLYLERLPVIASHIPAGVSTKTFVHYFQSYLSDNFQRFDYGPNTNEKMYLSREPPSYDLSLVTAPIYMYSSEVDWFSTPADVQNLINILPNIVEYRLLTEALDFTHLEFVYGERVNAIINSNITRILKGDV